MKPGVEKQERDYYQHANGEKPEGNTVLSNYARFKSNYQNKHNEAVHKGDYVVPAKSKNNMSKSIIIPKKSIF